MAKRRDQIYQYFPAACFWKFFWKCRVVPLWWQ